VTLQFNAPTSHADIVLFMVNSSNVGQFEVSASGFYQDYPGSMIWRSGVAGTTRMTLTAAGQLELTGMKMASGAGSGKVLTSDVNGVASWGAAGGSMTYPGAGIALSDGSAWSASVTNNSANWNTAYGWGDHSGAGYYHSGDSPSFVATTQTGDITFDNGHNVNCKDMGGTARQMLGINSDGTVIVAHSAQGSLHIGYAATGHVYLGSGGTDANPVYVRVGSADKNITIDANGFLKGA
jgi:hypothetical protein